MRRIERKCGNSDVVDCNLFIGINITWHDSFVDVTHGLGEPRTLVSLLLLCLNFPFPCIVWCIYNIVLQPCQLIKYFGKNNHGKLVVFIMILFVH